MSFLGRFIFLSSLITSLGPDLGRHLVQIALGHGKIEASGEMSRNSIATPSGPVDLALGATRVLHGMTNTPPSAAPFLKALNIQVQNVEKILTELHKGGCPPGSRDEQRTIQLLQILERLVSTSSPRFQGSGAPFSPTGYPQLNSIVHGRASAKTQSKLDISKRLDELARSNSSRARKDRPKFLKSLENFSPQKAPRGVPLFELVISGSVSTEDDTKSLQLLHSKLHGFVRHEARCEGEFRTNVALARVERLRENKEWVPFSLFLLHRHSGEKVKWKEIHMGVCVMG